MEIFIKNKKGLRAAAARLLDLTEGKKILAFYGSLGAGKTTIIKALCNLLGASDITSSPSFTLVNEYLTEDGKSIYHIDFYRIKNTEEVFDIGLEEYLFGVSYCFLEWPEVVEELLPPGTVRINIKVGKSEERILEIALT